MQIEPSVRIQNLPNAPAIQARILRSVKRLERFSDRITACRVALSASRRHRHGETVRVRIDLTVPGEEIVVDHDAGLDPAHAQVDLAIRDAFKAARRRLQDHVRRIRGDVKLHAGGGGPVVRIRRSPPTPKAVGRPPSPSPTLESNGSPGRDARPKGELR